MSDARKLTSAEFGELFPSYLCVLPVGALEPHGPHLPLDTDARISQYLAEEVAHSVPTVILPGIAYGSRTPATRVGGSRPGIIHLRASTLIDVVLDVLDAAFCHGARRFLLINAHYANSWILAEAVGQFADRHAEARVLVANWWDFQKEETRTRIAESSGVARDDDHHAGITETSIMMHIAPEMVRMDLICDSPLSRRVKYIVVPIPNDVQTEAGVIFRAVGASAEYGAQMCCEVIEKLVEAIERDL